MKAGMFASFAIAMLAAVVVVVLIQKSPQQIGPLVLVLFGVSVAAAVAMVLFGRAVNFPHCPRMTLEELETLRTEMGIPTHVFQQTHDSVLHGSADEIRAGWKAREFIRRIKNASGHIDEMD